MLEPLPALKSPLAPAPAFARHLPATAALHWFAAGWRDCWQGPWTSLFHGLVLFATSLTMLLVLDRTGLLYLALPAISGFLIIGPLLALGLYRKSQLLSTGGKPTLRDTVLFRPAAGGQIVYAGLLLGLLVLFWLRAADLLYALFFGLTPFPGAVDALHNVLTSARGWALIAVGGLVGALFAAFAFAISLFSLPMMMEERRDALTAFGMSFAMTSQNLLPVLAWGAIVMVGIAISLATAFLGFVIVFPVLGHATWHAYRAVHDPGRHDPGQRA